MKLKNFLIVVSDMEEAKKFYQDLFGLQVIVDSEANVILTDGLVLQEKKVWEELLGQEIASERNTGELYFEERDIETFVKKLERLYPSVSYVTCLTELEWGQKVVRFHDLDGNLIEVRTPGK